MEMVYRGMPVELARQQYDKMKEEPPKAPDVPVVKVRRKLRIPAANSK